MITNPWIQRPVANSLDHTLCLELKLGWKKSFHSSVSSHGDQGCSHNHQGICCHFQKYGTPIWGIKFPAKFLTPCEKALFTSLSDSDASQRFLINYCPGETECTAPSCNKCTQCKFTWQEVHRTTEIISYRGKIGISPFHMYFPHLTSVHLHTCLFKGNSVVEIINQVGFCFNYYSFAPAQHSCPTLFLFLITYIRIFSFFPAFRLPFWKLEGY